MKKVLFAIGISSLVAFTACNKNDDASPALQLSDADLTVTAESIATTDANLDDIVEEAEYEVELYSGTEEAVASFATEGDAVLKSGNNDNPFRYRYRWQKCPDIHIVSEEGGFPRTITLNYGEKTELENGRVLSGIIKIVMSGPRKENGATRTITFENFMVDTIAVGGQSVKTFLPDELKVNVHREMTFTLPDGTGIECTAERTKTWVEGMSTPRYHEDDRFEITGYSLCVDSDGNEFRKEITTPLIKKGGCRFIVAGEVTLSKNGNAFALINYGDGSCDAKATITTREGTKEFRIGQRIRERIQNRVEANS